MFVTCDNDAARFGAAWNDDSRIDRRGSDKFRVGRLIDDVRVYVDVNPSKRLGMVSCRS